MTNKKTENEAWQDQLRFWGFKSEEEYQEHQDKEKAKLLNKDKEGKVICILGLIAICLIGAVLL